MPVWWNWQTRRTQNPVVAIPCRFDPDYRHQEKTDNRLSFSFSFEREVFFSLIFLFEVISSLLFSMPDEGSDIKQVVFYIRDETLRTEEARGKSGQEKLRQD